ncbi:amino acid adenylation domain-containing protein [Paenibacillus oleatilyticus]|uniref:Amino acid adenylation domain-containing protein n=1 Tax=Paenibacillus oleatilyticus TaxID=2594886 RepID=A0ABV4VA52_9BACL
MSFLSERLSRLSPAQKRLLEEKWKQRMSSRLDAENTDRKLYPMSPNQQRLWLHQSSNPHDSSYHMSIAVEIKGPLHTKALEDSIRQVAARHEILRTSFVVKGGQAFQWIDAHSKIRIEQKDMSQYHLSAQCKDLVREQIEADTAIPFQLEQGPLLRAILYQLDEVEYVLALIMHHIISDGWSTSILVKELATIYSCQVLEYEHILPILPIQYKDYSVQQQQWLLSSEYAAEMDYWRNHLCSAPYCMELPVDYSRPVRSAHRGAVHAFNISQELFEGLKQLSRTSGTTLFTVLFAAFTWMLHQFTSENKIVVGVPVAGRNRCETEQLIGFFVNTLIFYTDVAGDPTFGELLKRVTQTSIDAYDHPNIPYDRIVHELLTEEASGYLPFSNIMFNFQSNSVDPPEIGPLSIKPFALESRTSKVDVTLECIEHKGNLECRFEYRTDLFKSDTIERIAKHFVTILTVVVLKPDIHCKFLPIPDEDRRLMQQWNETKAGYPLNSCIHEVFKKQVSKTPNEIAFICNGKQLTYRNLDEQSNYWANVLHKHGVAKGSMVGISMERSFEFMIAVISVLKLGAIFIPLDVNYPAKRLEFMIADSGIDIVLTMTRFIALLPVQQQTVICLDSNNDREVDIMIRPPTVTISPDCAAYMLYTSGSTGVPKGVLGSHRNAMNRLQWMWECFPFKEEDLCCQKTSTNFIDSIWEMFGPLLFGVTSLIVSEAEVRDVRSFIRLLQEHRVTRIVLVPSLLRMILDTGMNLGAELPSLGFWVVSGEELTVRLVQQFRRSAGQQTKLINLYGSSEVAADATWFDTSCLEDDARRVPIGKPIANTVVYILDEQMRRVPVGVAGELYIGGACVAKGYHHRPEMNQERFIPDPYSPGPDHRLFKTGDLGRFLRNGNLEFLGRKDSQIKLHGVRIELREVEAAILSHEEIEEAVVTLDRTSQTLCAFVKGDINLSDLKTFLKGRLPRQMIPAAFVFLQDFPRLPNGKIDRQQLLLAADTLPALNEDAPKNETELKLVEIWKDIFKREQVGTNIDFYEYGGHSIKASLLVFRIYELFHIQIPLTKVLDGCTIRDLALWIREGVHKPLPVITNVGEQMDYPASSAQARLYVIHHLANNGTAYNLPSALRIQGSVNLKRLERSIQVLIQRHEILRTSVHIADSGIVQRIHGEIAVGLPSICEDEQLLGDRMDRFVQPFDLSKAPLFRVLLVQHTDIQYTLLVDMHHIIADGTTIELLLTELIEMYNGETLPLLHLQYKDFAYWQQELLHSDKMLAHKEYWKAIFRDGVPLLKLPTDYPRKTARRRTGNHYQFQLSPELTRSLRQMGSAHESSLYVIILAAFGVLISRISGQRDLVVGSVVSGRQHPDLLHMAGVFINNLALRLQPQGEQSFIHFLTEVRKTVFGALEHQDYPYEELVGALKLERDINREPLFDVMLNWHNFEVSPKGKAEGLQISFLTPPSTGAKYDITLNAWETEGLIKFHLEYDASLFKPETIVRWSNHMRHIIHELVQHPDLPLSRISMMSGEEAKELIRGFHEDPHDSTLYSNVSVVREFLERVRQSPSHPSIIHRGRTYTYQELYDDACRIAAGIEEASQKGQEIVGIIMDRSYDMVAAILAVLKSGRAFLPIDPAFPAERIKYMMADSQARMLITDSRKRDMPEFDGMRMEAGILGAALPVKDVEEVKVINPDNLAYVIYTSGSTGKPKGVMIQHRALTNYVNGMSKRTGIGPSSVVLALTTVSFDIFITEVLLPLTVGATIVMAEEIHQHDLRQLRKLIHSHQPTVLQMTPCRLQLMLRQEEEDFFEHIEQIIVGGEAFPPSLLEELRRKYKGKVFNAYGPTEATVWASIKELSEVSEVTIGQPLAGYRMYILNEGMQLLPPGIAGHLYISGKGVAKGYLHQTKLTEERFIEDPFATGQRMYMTGDVARWLDNGEIELIGRADEQIKIRGYRIEPGEIEHWLLKYPGLSQAVVVKQGSGELAGLYAYYVGETVIDEAQLRQFLQMQLPAYMVPQYIIRLDRMPLTPNDKIDRQALKLLQKNWQRPKTSQSLEPKTTIQQTVAGIWTDLLQMDAVHLDDNFFDLGGNSILLMQMHDRISRLFPDMLTITDVFAYPTILHISEQLDRNLHCYKTLRLKASLIPEKYCSGMPTTPSGKCNLLIPQEMVMDLERWAQSLDSDFDKIILAVYAYTLIEWTQQREAMFCCALRPDHPNRIITLDADGQACATLSEWVIYLNKLYHESPQHPDGELLHAMQAIPIRNHQFIPGLIHAHHPILTDQVRKHTRLPVSFLREGSQFRVIFEYDGTFIRKKGVQEMAELFGDVLDYVRGDTNAKEGTGHE